jgi:hypothetical protein
MRRLGLVPRDAHQTPSRTKMIRAGRSQTVEKTMSCDVTVPRGAVRKRTNVGSR